MTRHLMEVNPINLSSQESYWHIQCDTAESSRGFDNWGVKALSIICAALFRIVWGTILL